MANTAEVIDSAQPFLNINMSNVIKLTSLNYITWSLKVHSLLDGYDLVGYVDGSVSSPAQTTVSNNAAIQNPDFLKWKRQDKLIYNGLLGTLSPSVQPLVTTTKTAAEMWHTVANIFAKHSKGHIQQLRLQLQQFSKGDKTINEYMQGLTTRFDKLALLGKPFDIDEQIEAVLRGLPEDYKYVVDQVEDREVSPKITEVHEKLLNKEAQLLTAALVTPSSDPLSANIDTSHSLPYPHKSTQHHHQQWNNRTSNTYPGQPF
ncbi:PREDICTED: uncharacterized protein LOC104707139 [Camelina sativa]|uniref:Uncharacterized protein LOC104707139 n=1 Tax=Camelina sativa TaxID=90675 RepID=A0ABM0T6R8_CAMSA|nr:PREDICTED: uncharacterized protein LOC104707139 [Camelina sativa]